jgi:hypothetical protein
MTVQNYTGNACQRPLDDLALIAALDDEADEPVLEHIRACPECAARAYHYADLQRFLRQQLFRVTCPPSDDLLAFHQRILNPERYVAVANHLGECPHCLRELGMLERANRVPGPHLMAAMLPRRKISLALAAPRPVLALLAFYGRPRGPVGAQYVYRADSIQLMLSVERTVGAPDSMAVSGFLSVDDTIGGQTGATASLLCGGQVVGSALIDDLGCFVIEGVPMGEHTLSLRLCDCEIVVETIRV